MSTSFRLSNRESALPKEELLAKLQGLGIREVPPDAPKEPEDRSFQLSDGENYLSAYPDDDGKVSDFEVFVQLRNDVRGICDAIEEVCEEVLLSEHDEGFFEDEDSEDDEDYGPN
jgi:hypothetical protein